MGEPGTGEGLPQHELQADFHALVQKFHRHAMDAFGQKGRFAGGVEPKDTPSGRFALGQLANAGLIDFSRLYNGIPEGHHLKIGVTPTDSGPTYWMHVGRRVGDRKTLPQGQSVLNITPVRNTSDEDPRIRFDFLIHRRDGGKRVSPSLYPENILSLLVVPDAPRRT